VSEVRDEPAQTPALQVFVEINSGGAAQEDAGGGADTADGEVELFRDRFSVFTCLNHAGNVCHAGASASKDRLSEGAAYINDYLGRRPVAEF
jgi:hypothetical protein